MRKEVKITLSQVVVLFALVIVLFLSARTFATSSGSSSSANLTIWDATDNVGTARFTVCTEYCAEKSKSVSIWNVIFYANFTNQTGTFINNSLGNVTIRFNETGVLTSWFNMTHNATKSYWQYNHTFTYKGTFNVTVNATSGFGNVTISDNVTISNTLPYIIKDPSGFIDFDNNDEKDTLSCNEDTVCSYNFSGNVSEDDANDVLTYLNLSENTTLTNFTLNSTTGILEINVTNNGDTGTKQVRLKARDTDSGEDTAFLEVSISKVNDAPVWNSLTNKSFNMTLLFEYVFNASDEENNIPFNFNISFLSCSTAEWSYRNSTDCELFNVSQRTINSTTGIINISFTPVRNDVGDYIIMFNVTDNNSLVTPYNQTTTKIVNFTVKTVNTSPWFRYVCNDNRSATENVPFNVCTINASDLDEVKNLTFTSNYTWFRFNDTGTNFTQVITNSTLNFNASAFVNFTPTDSEVGNWSLNITVRDAGVPQISNSTTFYFFIANVNDTLSVFNTTNKTFYTSQNYTIQINASDDDILIPDKSVYNESLKFKANYSLTVTSYEIPGTNVTTGNITINPNNLGAGNHSINITVRDANNFSVGSISFNIQVLSNTGPVWNSNVDGNYTVAENANFYTNISLNISDADNNALTFSNTSSFRSFFINSTTGEINFTPTDRDVGSHVFNISVTDGVAIADRQFNFTITNVNDLLNITNVTGNFLSPAVIFNNTQANTTEDANVDVFVAINDDDFNISGSTENITMAWSVTGPNTTLLISLRKDANYPVGSNTRFNASFTVAKSYIGYYNISLNATDSAGVVSYFMFPLNITGVEHPPNMTDIGFINTSITETLILDINTTDAEDINESFAGSNITYNVTNLTGTAGLLLKAFPINITTGVWNITLNQTFAGNLRFNVSVNDSAGSRDSEVFNISVYDFPIFLFPTSSYQFNLVENVTTALNFTINHTVQDNLNYTLSINGIFRNSTLAQGNGTEFAWNFTANFSDQTTCTGVVNLTLNVSNAKLSNTTSWNVTINNTNAPLNFDITISDKSGTSPLTITLSNHFSDSDASDKCTNQTIGFAETRIAGDVFGISITNWTDSGTPLITFTSASAGQANYSITAFEYTNNSYGSAILKNVTSNNFSVEIIASTSTTTSTTGGGGGGTVRKPVSLKLIVPEPVSAKKKDHLVIPIGLWNDGEVDLNDIILDSIVAKNGLLRTDLVASFDRSFIKKLPIGAKENVTLIVDIDTESIGIFEITINGTVRNPKYNDWSKFYVEITEADDIINRIIFTEEYIIGNPECTELLDLIEEARSLYASGQTEQAGRKADEALEACQTAISQPPSRRAIKQIGGEIVNYLALASLLSIVIGLVYYFYRRNKLRIALRGY